MQFRATLGSGGRKAFSPETRTRTILHMWNTHGPHNTNTHSDSSYPNIFFRLPICQLFKILTYREVQDTVSRYRWKPYRQPYDKCLYLIIRLHDKTFSYTFATTEVHIIWIYAKNKHSWKLGRKAPPPPPKNREIFFRLDLSISCNFQQLSFRWQKSPPPSLPLLSLRSLLLLPHSLPFLTTSIPPPPSPPSPRNRAIFFRLDLSISCNFQQPWFQAAGKPPLSFLPFHQRPGPGPYCTCGIPMVPIIQIRTQIPPIQISSLGYQFCQLFKILTYREVQDTASRYRWKPYRAALWQYTLIPLLSL